MTALPDAHARGLAQDLLDALWLEDLYGFRGHCTMRPAEGAEAVLTIALGDARTLRWQGRVSAGLRPFRVSEPTATLHVDASPPTAASLLGAVDALEAAPWWGDATGRFGRAFRLAIEQAAFTASHEPRITERVMHRPHELVSWEALSCLKDRPFHPLARAKSSNGTALVAQHAAEALEPTALRWLAVPHPKLLGCGLGQPIADTVLAAQAYRELASVAERRQGAADRYLWMPVHPAQWTHLTASVPAALDGCIDLGVLHEGGSATATASLRSLAVDARPDVHLKLSLSVEALGAVRTLPARYLRNGTLANAYLAQLRRTDDWLARHVWPCDESRWWAVRQRDALEAEPGELACLVRRYPRLPDMQLVPMAALPAATAAGTLPAFDVLLGANADAQHAWALFSDIAHALVELGLRCFAHGVMPELHGQNVLLAMRGSKLTGLVLRDHDTLRVCRAILPPGAQDALDYTIDRSTPNTLELGTPRQLLAYFQTLAIQVNLYAVIAALAHRYDCDEASGWRIVRHAVVVALDRVRLRLPTAVAQETACALLDEPTWPFKQVLAPVLARAQAGTGMPSAMGQLSNPLEGLSC